MKTVVIINPNAGTLKNSLIPANITKLLTHLGGITVWPAESSIQAEQLAQKAVTQKFNRIIVAGGDGTLHAVINGLAPDFSVAQLGILPLGTGNDVCRTLGIPLDTEGAIEVLRGDKSMDIDVLNVSIGSSNFYCINSLIAGFRTNDKDAAWKAISYLKAAANDVKNVTNHTVTLDVDGEVISEEAYAIIIANGKTAGGGVPVAPQADISDGYVDVTIIRSAPVSAVIAAIPAFLRGDPIQGDVLVTYMTVGGSVQADPPMQLSLDGELIGETPITFTVLPRAVSVLVP